MKYSQTLPDHTVNVSHENLFVQIVKFLVAFLLIGILLYVLMGFLVDKAVEHITPEQEKKLVKLIDFSPEIGSEVNSTYLQSLTQKLLPCANLPYAVQTVIVETQERNAFALPSGKIYVTRGMLKEVQSENELVGIIGHELGHFRHKHHLKGFGNSLILATMSLFLDSRYGALFAGSLKLSQAKYSQSAEYEADAFGLEVMECGYGNVAGATSLFSRMDHGNRWEYFLETHPDFASRVQKMKVLIKKRGYHDKARITPLKERF